MRKLEKVFSRSRFKEILLLLIPLVTFSLLRLPSVIEPYWYGDEGIYEVIGIALRQGRMLYSQIWDNKPPILYLIYALFNGDQFYVRLASLVVGILSVAVFFLIVKKIFKSKASVFVSTLFFAVVFGSPIIEGNIANAENFMLLPILLAFYFLFVREGKDRTKDLAIAGLLLSIAFLTKIVAVFDFAAFCIAIAGLKFFDTLSFDKKDIRKEIKNLRIGFSQEMIFGIAFLIPIILTALYFIFNHAGGDFFRAVFSQNVGYVGYGNRFIFPLGLLYLKLGILLISIFVVYRIRKHLGKYGFIIFTWLIFSVFDALFSARPYTHYLLVLLPSASLLIAYVIENKKQLKFTIPFVILLFILINSNFSFYKKNISYYQNYLSIIGGGSVDKYFNFFDTDNKRNYDLAMFIDAKTKPDEGVFLWSDSSPIYALSGKIPPGRYIVSYHMTFYKNAISETKKAIEEKKPKYIIATKGGDQIQNFLDNYELRYKIDNASIYERQF